MTNFDLSRVHTIDFETTDVDTKKAKPVELALWNPQGVSMDYLINPGCPIPPETSAVHHITDEDVANAPDWDSVLRLLRDALTQEPIPILVAHNADYEKGMLTGFDVPVLWICTYKCALRIWPDAPGHKNEVLRYWLKLDDGRGRAANQRPHSAMHDARVTYGIFLKLLEHATIEEMVEWTEVPAKLPHMPMGKHYKQAWDIIPGPYLQWCINQTEMREDVKYCASQELARRKSNATSGSR